MTTIIYDGSFAGLLTANYYIFKQKWQPDAFYVGKPESMPLFGAVHEFVARPDLAEAVSKGIIQSMGQTGWENVYLAFLCNHPQKEMLIYNYLDLGWQLKTKIHNALTHPQALPLLQQVRKVKAERHLFYGLIRFTQLNGDVYYSSLCPDHNIVGLLCEHFAARFGRQKWIIHDLKRGLAAFYNGQSWQIAENIGHSDLAKAERASDEAAVAALWQKYYQNIAILNRLNPGTQKNFMPKRYWPHLTEQPGSALQRLNQPEP